MSVTPIPRVAVLLTGGTVAMKSTESQAYDLALTAVDVMGRVTDVTDVAEIELFCPFSIPSSHMTFESVLRIAGLLRGIAARTDVDGIVVVQGTDTIEETSFAWDLLLRTDKPVIVTGAMHGADRATYDGPRNIRDAILCAASQACRGSGVLVVAAGEIHAADVVTKWDSRQLVSFLSPGSGPIGLVADRAPVMQRVRRNRRHIETEHAVDMVAIVPFTIGMDAMLFDAAVAAGVRAIVVAGAGAGNTAPGMLSSAKRAMTSGVTVAIASRCLTGGAHPDYGYPGGGARWREAGALVSEELSPTKTRIVLALALGSGRSAAEIQRLLTAI